MPKKLETKSRLSYRTLVLFAVIFAAVGGYILWRSFAAPAAPTIYLTPASQTFGPSSSFTVQIRENSGTTTVNAVQANLSYNTSLLTLSKIDTTGSAFGITAQSSGANGVINIGMGASAGSPALSGDQLVATLSFTTTATGGTASVPFTTGTALVSSTTNANILPSLTSTGGGTFVTDTQPPTVSITSPAGGSTVAAPGTLSISVTAADASSSVSKVELYIDGALKTTLTASPYNYSWNTSGVSLGGHTILAKAYDSFNNVSSSASTSVTLADKTAPSVSITAPSGSSTVAGTVTVSSNAADNTGGTGVSKVELYVDGSLNATDTASPYSFSWNTTTASNASHSLTVKAYDGASPANVTTSAAVNVTVDNSAPSAPSSLRMTSNTLNSISLAWNAASDNVAVTGYKLSRNGNVIANLPAGTLTYSDSGLTGSTSYNYSLVAADAAGNTSAAATLAASTVSSKPGDLDGSGAVDVRDLSILLSNFGSHNAVADIDGSGTVDIIDLSILLSHYGS